MSDLIERVARGMQAVSRPDVDPDKLTPGPRGSVTLCPVWSLYDHMARAAIAEMLDAMGEPSEAMIETGFRARSNDMTMAESANAVWQAMLAQFRKENGL